MTSKNIYFSLLFLPRSQETPEDGQPPALPPKQSKKNSWNQIHFSNSQQDLVTHTNESFDVPSSPEKSTVSSFA
jgi:tyrosine-protein phosphatase non-receptor type 4